MAKKPQIIDFVLACHVFPGKTTCSSKGMLHLLAWPLFWLSFLKYFRELRALNCVTSIWFSQLCWNAWYWLMSCKVSFKLVCFKYISPHLQDFCTAEHLSSQYLRISHEVNKTIWLAKLGEDFFFFSLTGLGLLSLRQRSPASFNSLMN